MVHTAGKCNETVTTFPFSIKETKFGAEKMVPLEVHVQRYVKFRKSHISEIDLFNKDYHYYYYYYYILLLLLLLRICFKYK